MRSMALGKVTLLEALAERESIYRLLAQSTPENTSKDFASYTVDPRTRYPTLNTKLLSASQVTHLVDTDNPSQLQEDLKALSSKNIMAAIPASIDSGEGRRTRKMSTVSPDTLLSWLAKQVENYDKVVISDMTTSFQNGLALCAIIHRYRPDLIDFHTLDSKEGVDNIQLAFDLLDQDLGISPVMKATELANTSKIPDKLSMMSYLSQVYECFRKDIPTNGQREAMMEGIVEDAEDELVHKTAKKGGISMGQMVARKANKKRRSKESQNDTKEEVDQLLMSTGANNKENVSETVRMNRSANRKRLLSLMQRAEASANEKKKVVQRKSIKEEDRFKVIEQMATGHSKRRSGDSIAKYRENKKPKELKRAIGKIDKDDWNIKNIEEKLVIANQTPDTKKDKVPKWSKAAFQDKFNIMKGKLESDEIDTNKTTEKTKFKAIDQGLAKLQRKLREGSALDTGERGSNRVSALADGVFSKQMSNGNNLDNASSEQQRTENSYSSRKKSSLSSSSSENCHFCSKRVYVVERMSAEGKFFHRSCFRCDYCNILLRSGSYVYHRDGTPFSGKFFCIPHSTENALEKYRYRKKADEIKDAQRRQQEQLIHKPNQEWTSAPNSYINSLPARHKERLLASLDPAQMRGTTPERAEFEASIDLHSAEDEDGGPSIMDEDEWTDRNFGGNSLIILEDDEEEDHNTSEDSVTDLDSDDDVRLRDDNGKPLTAREARQLQREWLRRYDDRRNNDEEEAEDVSQYDNVGKRESNRYFLIVILELSCYLVIGFFIATFLHFFLHRIFISHQLSAYNFCMNNKDDCCCFPNYFFCFLISCK
jgi:hypothetical protein